MRKLIFIVLFFLIGWYCDSQSPQGVGPPHDVSLAMSFRDPPSGSRLSLSFIDSMMLQISHQDDTLALRLPFDGVSADTQLTIPANKKVRFWVQAFKDSQLIMTGDTTVMANPGERIDLSLSLTFVKPALILTPARQEVKSGEDLRIDVAVRNMPMFYRVSSHIDFNANILEIKSWEMEEDFLSRNGGQVTSMLETDVALFHHIRVNSPEYAVSGSGTLGGFRMQAMRNGLVHVQVSTDSSAGTELGVYDQNDQLIPTVNLGCMVVVN